MKLIFRGSANFPAYHNQTLNLHLVAGQEFEVADAIGRGLMADFGMLFAECVPLAVAQAPVGPAEHRQIVEPPRRGRPGRR